MRRSLAAAAACTVLVVSACSGDGASTITGKWRGDSETSEILEFRENGTATGNANGVKCTGTVKDDGKAYRIEFRCGQGKVAGTGTLSSNKKKLTITGVDGKASSYTRQSS